MTDTIVKEGNYVEVEYTGTFEDGSVFDSSEGKQPLEILAGKGMLIKGFDAALVGMKVGEEKEVDIEPVEAYGHRNEELIKEIPKKQFGNDVEPKVGMVLGVKAPTGQMFPAKVLGVNADNIKLDLNHPLAGKKLHFKLKVVASRTPTPEDMKKFQPQEDSCAPEGCSSCSGC